MTTGPPWAAQASIIHEAIGNSSDLVITPAGGGSPETYTDCRDRLKTVREQNQVGVYVDVSRTIIRVPQLDGATTPVAGAKGVYKGRRYDIKSVDDGPGTWRLNVS